MTRRWPLFALLVAAACGPSSGTIDATGGGDDAAGPLPDAFTGPFDDFPADPIIDTGDGATTPPNAPDLFGGPGSGTPTGGPCLAEPEIGTLFPRNWLRPRFSWIATGGQNLFELRLTSANQVNPLVVYTTSPTWTMPAPMWSALTTHIADQPITLTIRGAVWDSSSGTLTTAPALGSSGDIAIAPVAAPGAIVYWTTTGGSALRGFEIGDETVRDIVRPATAGTACVGCHSSTPDGLFVGFAASPNAGNGDPATLGLRSADGNATEASFLTDAARTLMARQNQEQPVFSRHHWQAGDRVGVTMFPIDGRFEIMWTDLEATSTDQGVGWGVLARSGDSNPAAYASFAHQDDHLLYVSAPTVTSGVTVTAGDLATIPYNARAGGTSTLIAGASTAEWNEYYPTYSPDDRFIAFNRVASGETSYNNAMAEVFALPPDGTPLRLAANDPPACSGRTSPGVTNSWPRWAPEVGTAGTRTFYWLTFSSTRSPGSNPQLYITPVVEDGATITTYPALYLWNQPAAENNHTPAWDVFDIPVE